LRREDGRDGELEGIAMRELAVRIGIGRGKSALDLEGVRAEGVAA
jgi:hypothetical protein